MITPKLVGNRVSLEVLSAMVSLIIGGNLFRLTGFVAAILIGTIVSRILQDVKSTFQSLSICKGRDF